MPFLRFFVIVLGGSLLLANAIQYRAFAQDETESAATQNSSDSLQELFRQWKELDAELATKESEFKAASDPDAQEDVKGQYKALVTQSEELVERIREKAIESLDAGSLDEMSSKLLVGIIMNDASFDRHNEAIKLGDRYISAGGDGAFLEAAAKAERLSLYSRELMEELFVRSTQTKQNDLPQVKIETSKGEMIVELFEEEAPNTVANFVSLVEDQFYDGLKFHRVIEGFVAQGGDPNGDGTGGPGYSIKCECESPEARRHFIGSLSMAHSGPDTGGSQFFICLDRKSTKMLDGKHTVFGRVISGIDVLDRLSRNALMNKPIEGADTDVVKKMEVVRKREHEYKPEKVGEETVEQPTETPPTQPETTKDDDDPALSGEDESSDETSGG